MPTFLGGKVLFTGLAVIGMAVAMPAGNAQTFSNPTSIAIGGIIAGDVKGPATPYPSSIVVATTGLITNITVSFVLLTHTFASDIDAVLVGPNGQNVMLMSDAGGNSILTNTNLNFADGSPLLPGGFIASGTYRPTNYVNGSDLTDTFPAPGPGTGPFGNLLSIYNGTDPNGTWDLFVVDDELGDFGAMRGGWSLTIETIPEPSTYALVIVGATLLLLAGQRRRQRR